MSRLDHDIRWWRERVSQRAGIVQEDLDELEDHLRILVDQYVRDGQEPEAAFRLAASQLSDVETVPEDWVRSSAAPPLDEPWSPPTRRFPNVGEIAWSLIQDLRFAVRTLAKKPGYAAVVVLVLAIGIGINSSMFSLIHSVIWRPPNIDRPEEIVVFASVDANGRASDGLSYLDFLDFEETMADDGGMALHFPLSMQLHPDDEPGRRGPGQRVWGNITSANYFETLGVRATLGHTYDESARSDSEPVVVLGHSLWQKRFGGDSAIIGRQVLLNAQSFTVVAVAPPGFRGAHALIQADLWIPLSSAELLSADSRELLRDRKSRNLWAVGRLHEPSRAAPVEARLRDVAERLAETYPESNEGLSIAIFPESHSRMGMGSGPVLRLASLVMLASVALVLLIACVNVANLVLVRAAGRRREISVRLAMGASRARVIRQLLTESLVLSTVGGVAGLAMAAGSMQLVGRALATSTPEASIPLFFDPQLHPTVVLYALGLSIVTAVLFGLFPALQVSRANWGGTLRSEGRALSDGAASGRLRRGLVAAEVAACLVLLVTASLFARSLQNVVRADVGFDPRDRIAVRFDLGSSGYDADRRDQFYRDLRDEAATLPGVRSATWAMPLPLDTFGTNTSIHVDGYDTEGEASNGPLMVFYSNVDAHYFDGMGTPILEGRPLRESDTRDALPVAVVNRTMAERYWPGGRALGQSFRLDSAEGTEVRVVGVAADGKYRTITEPPVPFVYFSQPQRLRAPFTATLVVHSSQPMSALMDPIREAGRRHGEAAMMLGAQTLEQHLRSSAFLPATLAATLVSAFGLLGLLLATIGLYGVLSYSVSQQTSEIGLRMAMGATPTDILRMVLASGLKLTSFGIVAGLVLSIGAGRLVVGLLHNVSAFDPLSFALVPPVLALVALLASWIPARRATRIDPTRALRNE